MGWGSELGLGLGLGYAPMRQCDKILKFDDTI